MDDLPIGIGDLAKTQISRTLGILGFCIDVSGMVNEGVDENKALAAAFIHAAVGVVVGLLLAKYKLVGVTLVVATMALTWVLNEIVNYVIMV